MDQILCIVLQFENTNYGEEILNQKTALLDPLNCLQMIYLLFVLCAILVSKKDGTPNYNQYINHLNVWLCSIAGFNSKHRSTIRLTAISNDSHRVSQAFKSLWGSCPLYNDEYNV